MEITDVVAYQVTGTLPAGDYPGVRQWQVQPLHLYDRFRPKGAAPGPVEAGKPVSDHFLEIQTDSGATGLFGGVTEAQVWLILRELRPFLRGRDPMPVEMLQDQMIRRHRHGRSGLYLTAVSAVDIALWDLKAKHLGLPLARMLGGGRESVPAYASMLGFSVKPEEAAAAAGKYRDAGFPAQKWFFAHGPGSGEAGLRANVLMAEAVREAVGAAYPLMFDAFNGWDEPYARRMVDTLARIRPHWLEEALPPENISGLARLRSLGRVPIATGEHVYGRLQSCNLIDAGAVDFLQNDPDWTGGITEQRAVCAMASAHGIPVVAHGHSLHPALAVAASESPATVPWVEVLVAHQATKQHFFSDPLLPEQGMVSVPDRPGLGIELDPQKAATKVVVEL